MFRPPALNRFLRISLPALRLAKGATFRRTVGIGSQEAE